MNHLNELLQESKDRLLQPLAETRRTYLIIFNLINALLTLSFMAIGKVTLGSYVVAYPLLFLYTASIIISLLTAFYNILKIYNNQLTLQYPQFASILNSARLDNFLSKASVVFILLMSVGGITGYGNPSSDALITNFSFAHSMIVAIVIIIGRKVAFGWGIIVLAALFFNMFTLGWDYEYHYLTPSEAKIYKERLAKGDPQALERKAELEKHKLSPPSALKYFRLWFTFILVSLFIVWTFGGIITKTYEVIPSVVTNIEKSIQSSLKINVELEHKRSEVTNSAVRISRYMQAVDKINYELEKMDYSDRKKFYPILKIMRESIQQEEKEVWEKFVINFEHIHADFWKSLQKQYFDLSSNELKHLAYLKLNMNNDEIASQLNVTLETLRTMRYRLRKKLFLPEGIDLKTFVNSI